MDASAESLCYADPREALLSILRYVKPDDLEFRSFWSDIDCELAGVVVSKEKNCPDWQDRAATFKTFCRAVNSTDVENKLGDLSDECRTAVENSLKGVTYGPGCQASPRCATGTPSAFRDKRLQVRLADTLCSVLQLALNVRDNLAASKCLSRGDCDSQAFRVLYKGAKGSDGMSVYQLAVTFVERSNYSTKAFHDSELAEQLGAHALTYRNLVKVVDSVHVILEECDQPKLAVSKILKVLKKHLTVTFSCSNVEKNVGVVMRGAAELLDRCETNIGILKELFQHVEKAPSSNTSLIGYQNYLLLQSTVDALRFAYQPADNGNLSQDFSPTTGVASIPSMFRTPTCQLEETDDSKDSGICSSSADESKMEVTSPQQPSIALFINNATPPENDPDLSGCSPAQLETNRQNNCPMGKQSQLDDHTPKIAVKAKPAQGRRVQLRALENVPKVDSLPCRKKLLSGKEPNKCKGKVVKRKRDSEASVNGAKQQKLTHFFGIR